MATYLDNAGVTQILTKIKSLLAKKAEITAIPTKVSQLTNDSKYANKGEVEGAINAKMGTLSSTTVETNSGNADKYVTSVSQEEGLVSVTSASFNERFLTEVELARLDGKIAGAKEVNAAIKIAVGKITSFEYKIVDSLPATSEGKKGVVYLVAHSGSTNQNSYDEYIFLPAEGSTKARYEKIGTTDIDLTPYAKKTEIPTKVSQLTNDENYATQNYAYNTIRDEITDLDYSDTAVAGQYVSSVSETDGVIKVTRASLPAVGTADSPISNATIESIFTQVFG